MINVKQFRDMVISNTLAILPGCQGTAATNLLLGTAIQESRLTYLAQLDGDSDNYDNALGLYQMERATHDDIWENYLAFRPELGDAVRHMTGWEPRFEELVGNLWYATAMTRIHYRRVPTPLPEWNDVEGMADYWKEHYNTFEGSGTVEEYIENWNVATFGL